MANMPEATDRSTAPGDRLQSLVQLRQRLAYGLFGLGIVLNLVPILLGIKYREELLGTTIATCLLPLGALLAGLLYYVLPREKLSPVDTVRVQLLCLCAVTGLALIAVALTLAVHWRQFFLGGLAAWQGSEGWRVWVFLLLQIGGLGIMFGGLQFLRSEQHGQVWMRRLLYGYNAGLSGIFLLEILLVLMILTTAILPQTDDWTSRSIHSLSSKSENILKGLDKPVEVYVILSRDDDLMRENIKGLLESCRAVDPKISATYLTPDLNQERVIELIDKYHFSLGERGGVLVVHGITPNTEHKFIKATEMLQEDASFGRQRKPPFFKGEAELISALSVLSETKEKPVLYFTQGNGELDLADLQSQEIDRGAGILKRRLEGEHLTVKGLEISPVAGLTGNRPQVVVDSKVPSDAIMVVIAGPRRRLTDPVLKALRDYMNPPPGDKQAKGKLIVLLDVVVNAEGQMEQLGLKEFLAEFSVEVGDNRVLQISRRPLRANPKAVLAYTNPASDFQTRNPVAAAFQTGFALYDVRTVRPAVQPRPGFTAESLLIVPRDFYVVPETDVKTPPGQILARLMNQDNVKELQQKISQDNLSVAVVVTEQAAQTPPNPHMPPPRDEGKPRLIVVGDASIASNVMMQEQTSGRNFDLFASMVSWLRERPSGIGIEPKTQSVYSVDPADVNIPRMILLPTVLFFVGIIGLGTGVWVVRRR